MNLGVLAALALAGGVGAGIRYLIDALVMRGRDEAFPVGILLVNVSGSAALGLVTGFGTLIASDVLAIIGVGLLGGYTTFSTVAVDSVRLMRRGRRDWALVNLLGTFGAAVVAAALGLTLAGLLPG